MNTLIIINDPPYGTERMFNALRLAGGLVKAEDHKTTVFHMGDSVSGAKAGQKTLDGYYNVERMLRRILDGKGEFRVCGICLDARAIADDELLANTRRSTKGELVASTMAADKVLVF
ncbi:DsrE/DsrF/TusD sulfur relay family protein [Delftia acidovorans]|uniref:DsrE family protein n=1 Tax=Delftia acidovorans TaxID=80866 RepID=A0AAJ2V8C3_DELAC|nr:DsrE family protein [Delftia acidovorans]MDX4953625.1 DsrE family protein [Delftia acidovorans]